MMGDWRQGTRKWKFVKYYLASVVTAEEEDEKLLGRRIAYLKNIGQLIIRHR